MALTGLFFAASLTAIALVQEANDDPPPPDARLWFAFQRESALEDLVETCARVYGLPLEFEPGAFEGTVTLQSCPGLTAVEL